MIEEVGVLHGFGEVAHGLDLADEDALAVPLAVGGEIEQLDGLVRLRAQAVGQGNAVGRAELDVQNENIGQALLRGRPDRRRVLKLPQAHAGQRRRDRLLQAAQIDRFVIAEPNVVQGHPLLLCLLLLSYHTIPAQANPRARPTQRTRKAITQAMTHWMTTVAAAALPLPSSRRTVAMAVTQGV